MRFIAQPSLSKIWIFLYLVGLNFEIQAQFNYGTTVIVHGFQLTGSNPKGTFDEYATYIKNRIGGNATIYIAEGYEEGSVELYTNMYWKRTFGDGRGEQIFVYDWGDASNNFTTGDLEAAADRLFGMLIKPLAFDQNNKKIDNINIGQPLNRPSHFIAHSRGAILCLQVFHRLLVRFPSITIQHFTALDPHPAAEFGDIISTQEHVNSNLPGVEGRAEDCAIVCAVGKNVTIKVPKNVSYAESIYRYDGNYEQGYDFDGVHIDNNNTLLNDEILGGDYNLIDSPHSRVHKWYFGTVNLDWFPNDETQNWYNDKYGSRDKVGWYKSRLGGNLNLLKKPISRNNPTQLDKAIRLRQGKPLSVIFNGSFDHQTVNWGFSESMTGNTAWKYITPGNKQLTYYNKNGRVRYMSSFYVPKNSKFLTFKVFKNSNQQHQNNVIKIQWLGLENKSVGDKSDVQPCPQKDPNKDYKSYKVPIPEELLGNLASFELIINPPVNIGSFTMDDFDVPINVPEKNEGSKSQKEDCDDEPEDPPQIPVPNPDQGKAITPSVLAAFDPNDKLGPVGVNAQRYITGNQPAGYQIRFENYATATAAAQYVKVIDTLDLNLFDPSTFQFGYFNIANSNFYAPPGKKKYLKDQDLRPTKNLILRMVADFNDTTGILQATYTALDPATMELTEDPILGFLPPNTKAPEGEGSLFFTVSTYPTLPHGTEISNKAHIYFDYNPVIPTPPWINTLDKIEPTSQVQNLPAVSNDTTLALHWGGSDVGAGTRLYNVYVAVNNNSYKLLVKNTGLTSINFKGKPDSTYKFYSVAVDSVGNEESAPITFDTQTTIQLTSVGVVQSVQSGDWNNPATWNCNCVPSATQNVIIKSGHKVTLTPAMGSQFCKNLTVESGAVFDAKGVFLAHPR